MSKLKTALAIAAMASGLAANLAVAELDELIGEWAIDGHCRESRMVFDLEGGFDLRVDEGGRWKPLYGGHWSRHGARVEMTVGETREHWQIESISTTRAILVNTDGPVDRDLGIGYLELTRCPAF